MVISSITDVLGFGDTDTVDITVTIPAEFRHDTIRDLCDGDDRWLYAAALSDQETMYLLGGPGDEPIYDASKQQRVVDAVSHETMHIVLAQVLDEENTASAQYDDLLYEVLEPTTYLHYYAQGDDE